MCRYLLYKTKYRITTHKNGSKVRVFVDVHVTQIHQQSCHAVEETDNANAYEKLSSRGGVADQVRRCYRVVTNSGVRCNKWNLAQPGHKTQRKSKNVNDVLK